MRGAEIVEDTLRASFEIYEKLKSTDEIELNNLYLRWDKHNQIISTDIEVQIKFIALTSCNLLPH